MMMMLMRRRTTMKLLWELLCCSDDDHSHYLTYSLNMMTLMKLSLSCLLMPNGKRMMMMMILATKVGVMMVMTMMIAEEGDQSVEHEHPNVVVAHNIDRMVLTQVMVDLLIQMDMFGYHDK
jgi:hypothetical protein